MTERDAFHASAPEALSQFDGAPESAARWREPAFRLGRQLRGREFRAYLSASGYVPGTPIVIVSPEDTDAQIAVRVGAHSSGVALCATPDADAPHGWRLRPWSAPDPG